MLKIQKNKYLLGFMCVALLLFSGGFAQDVKQEVKDRLDDLMVDHVSLTLQSLKDSLDQASTQQITIESLHNNTTEIAEIIGDIYDIETGSEFLEVWRLRVGYFDDYLMFINSGDPLDQESVLENLATADSEAATFLQGIVSGFSGNDAEAQLNSVTGLFLSSIEDYAAGNTSSAASKESTAQTQIGVLSTSLGDGVAADIIITVIEEPEPESNSESITDDTAGSENNIFLEDPTAPADPIVTTATEEKVDSTAPISSFLEGAAKDSAEDIEAEKRELVKTLNNQDSEEEAAGEDTTKPIDFPFVDVNQSHDYTSILDMRDRGIVSGYDDGTYRPDNAVNRAEFTKIVVGAVVPAAYGLNCFSDVGQEWFAAYVCTAKDQNIVGGYADGTFKPGNEVNLAEAYKIVGETLFSGEVVTTDVWYQGYVNLAIDRGYYLGTDLAVTGSVTREQLATIVSRALATQE